jgi:amidohydrolase
MVKAGIFNNLKPDAVFGIHTTFHPTGSVGYATGTQNSASEVITITITGMQTHGSMPFMGRDPLPVLAAINDGFAQVHRQIDSNEPLTISIGKIDTVGRSNIIGETITASGTVRALNQQVIEDVNKRLERIVVKAAEMHGLSATIAFDQMVPPVINKEDWVQRFGPSAERVVGKDKVFDIKPSMGYDDVSVLMNKADGGMYFLVGAQNTAFKEGQLVSAGTPGLIPNHNPGFYANDAALETGVRLHAYVAMDFLNGK